VERDKQRDVQVGYVTAEAFQRLAEDLVGEIGQVPEGFWPVGDEPPAGFGDLVASAANLAFALELYLNTLLFQRDEPVPRHHDLLKLWDAVSAPAKDQIEDRYEKVWRSEWLGKQASVTIAFPNVGDESEDLCSRTRNRLSAFGTDHGPSSFTSNYRTLVRVNPPS